MSIEEPAKIFLLPGEAAFSKKRAIVSTLLGSCVAVCLHDKQNRWGGMNHYMIPRAEDANLARGKCGDLAIKTMISLARVAGSRKADLRASVFGGARMLSQSVSSQSDIGGRNIKIAYQMLEALNIEIVRHEVGGVQGRKIRMDTATNEIHSELIPTSDSTRQRALKLQKFSRQKIGVLIIDDSAIVRKVLRLGIESSDDMEVLGEAQDPFEAREKILETDPDVLTLDIIMPRLDGISFLKKIMQYKPIPTIIVSTIATEGSTVREKALRAGAVDVLNKEELELYKGLEVVKGVLLPKLRKAAATIVTKTSSQ